MGALASSKELDFEVLKFGLDEKEAVKERCFTLAALAHALAHVQQLNGFVPTPTLLNSPSFLAPLIQSVTVSTANNEQTKTVTSPVLASPNRQ
ncbi:unnamed protein product [Gongylonema pulchrum]|uniref:Ovule protein n=1 Tax=Gongylonema pulchrum TaxID=637853 RepID=A0A183EK17_9BILA|nr:unnamed protein product [Gongylonema pulchrum]